MKKLIVFIVVLETMFLTALCYGEPKTEVISTIRDNVGEVLVFKVITRASGRTDAYIIARNLKTGEVTTSGRLTSEDLIKIQELAEKTLSARLDAKSKQVDKFQLSSGAYWSASVLVTKKGKVNTYLRMTDPSGRKSFLFTKVTDLMLDKIILDSIATRLKFEALNKK